jgi:hypothetical protein
MKIRIGKPHLVGKSAGCHLQPQTQLQQQGFVELMSARHTSIAVLNYCLLSFQGTMGQTQNYELSLQPQSVGKKKRVQKPNTSLYLSLWDIKPRHFKGSCEILHLSPQLQNLPTSINFTLDLCLGVSLVEICSDLHGAVEKLCNRIEVPLVAAPRRHSRGANPHTTRLPGAPVSKHGRLVHSDVTRFTDIFQSVSSDAKRTKVYKKEMVVSSVRHQLAPPPLQPFRQRLRIPLHLLDILLVLLRTRLFKRHCQRCNMVVVRTSLQSRMDGEVDVSLESIHAIG